MKPFSYAKALFLSFGLLTAAQAKDGRWIDPNDHMPAYDLA